jgi:HD-GYP domain-containing protein (c-di-GMP phosphodiesterase class II)
MSDTQTLLAKITALRQRLEQAQGLVRDAGTAAAALMPPDAASAPTMETLEIKVAAGARLHALLETSLRQLPEALGQNSEPTRLPPRLTARAARLLERARDVLDQLRRLADEPCLQAEKDPLAVLYREATAMIDTVLRTIQAFPETPSVQLRLCEGLEAILAVVSEHLLILRAGLREQQREETVIRTLADLLIGIAAGQSLDSSALAKLAEQVLDDAHQDRALRFFYQLPDNPVRFIACHCLTVAQVAARITRHEAEWRQRPLEPVMAALVHDVGMLCVPREILAHPGPLDEAQKRQIETHAHAGAEMLARSLPGMNTLSEAAAYHHERLDGTGYPSGLRDQQITPLVRLLAVGDVYAALCLPRPQRPAFDTRTAVTDTLLLAEQGLLDRHQAELLLKLSFYPPGSLVELADGAVAMVVATHQGRRDLNTPARPVLAVLTDSHGQPLPAPHHVDLSECESRSIVRNVAVAERRRVLGRHYPSLS